MRNFRSVDLMRKGIQILLLFKGKQTVGELCDKIELGWTCCVTCCEVNTGNKRTLVQQNTETHDLLYKQFI